MSEKLVCILARESYKEDFATVSLCHGGYNCPGIIHMGAVRRCPKIRA
jgi:hypothetical protein